MTNEHEKHEALDRAVSKRLGRLSTVPVDSAALKRRLARQLEAHTDHPAQRRLPVQWLRPTAALAAALLIALGVILIQDAATSPAVAAPIELAQLHRQVVAGDAGLNVQSVGDLQDANRMIAAQSSGRAELPSAAPAAVQSCCLGSVHGEVVACALMTYHDQPVTLVVADGRDLCSMDGLTVTRDGRRYMVHEVDGLTMVMTQRDNKWLCVMGEMDAEALLDLAGGVVF